MTERNGSQRLSGPGVGPGHGVPVSSEPGIGFMAGFESVGGEWTYRATVSRSIPSSRQSAAGTSPARAISKS